MSYIVFLHQTTTCSASRGITLHCLISSFYIKPQHLQHSYPRAVHCLISSFYIKPQLTFEGGFVVIIVLYRLSTSNHNYPENQLPVINIVLYRLSTSNHNYSYNFDYLNGIVLYRLSTSNHNLTVLWNFSSILSYIVFLHQTTTWVSLWLDLYNCLISSFYIKPQHADGGRGSEDYCLISSFYIKPQHTRRPCWTLSHCLISSFYIKPQLCAVLHTFWRIVLYRLSTSNHNLPRLIFSLSLIVLYRLSTSNHNVIVIPFHPRAIVLYRLSTSNHNRTFINLAPWLIVLYRLSTSNHNLAAGLEPLWQIVLYRLSTSNHNPMRWSMWSPRLSYIVFLHQTTTVLDIYFNSL